MITYKVHAKGIGNSKISFREDDKEMMELFEKVGKVVSIALRIKGKKGTSLVNFVIREVTNEDADESGPLN